MPSRRRRLPDSACERGAARRPAVATRALEQHQQRVPVHPRRGHPVRPEQPERRLLRGYRRASRAARRRHRSAHAWPSGTIGPFPNGRIFKMVFDRRDETKVQSLSVLIDGDARGAAGSGRSTHQPDNVETTKRPPALPGGPGQPQPVPARYRHDCSPLGLRPEGGRRAVRHRQGRPVGRRRADRQGRLDDQGSCGRLGVERHRRCLQGVRQGRVPPGRPGGVAHRRGGAARAADLPARGRAAAAAPAREVPRRARRPQQRRPRQEGRP